MLNFTAHGSRLANYAFRLVGNQTGDRFSRLRDDDFFSAGSPIDEPGKLRLRLMDIYLSHSGLSLVRSLGGCQLMARCRLRLVLQTEKANSKWPQTYPIRKVVD